MWPSMFLTPPNKSNTLHFLRLDSGVLRVVLSRLADCAKCACFLGVERRLFRLVSSWLDFPLHRVGASDPESKPLEEVMRLIKPQGGAEFVMPFYENWKAACCQMAFRRGLLPSRSVLNCLCRPLLATVRWASPFIGALGFSKRRGWIFVQ